MARPLIEMQGMPEFPPISTPAANSALAGTPMRSAANAEMQTHRHVHRHSHRRTASVCRTSPTGTERLGLRLSAAAHPTMEGTCRPRDSAFSPNLSRHLGLPYFTSPQESTHHATIHPHPDDHRSPLIGGLGHIGCVFFDTQAHRTNGGDAYDRQSRFSRPRGGRQCAR